MNELNTLKLSLVLPVHDVIEDSICSVNESQLLPDGTISYALADGRRVRLFVAIEGEISQNATTIVDTSE